MEAPLGNIVRKILTNQKDSEKLMQQLIMGDRFEAENNYIFLDNKKFKVVRVDFLNGSSQK